MSSSVLAHRGQPSPCPSGAVSRIFAHPWPLEMGLCTLGTFPSVTQRLSGGELVPAPCRTTPCKPGTKPCVDTDRQPPTQTSQEQRTQLTIPQHTSPAYAETPERHRQGSVISCYIIRWSDSLVEQGVLLYPQQGRSHWAGQRTPVPQARSLVVVLIAGSVILVCIYAKPR